MARDYTKPFDDRLTFLTFDTETKATHSYTPYDISQYDTDVYTFLMSIESLEDNMKDKRKEVTKDGKTTYEYEYATGYEYKTVKNPQTGKMETVVDTDASGNPKIKMEKLTETEFQNLKKIQEQAINKAKNNKINWTLHSIMNPYAMIHLSGGINYSDGTNRLIDKSDKKTWYDTVDSSSFDPKDPTTETIIKWGCLDEKGRTPYLFQDFVFCKWWNKIPNNRLITLRRYTNPVLDNLNTPFDNLIEDPTDKDDYFFPPISTLVTYFGDDTGNNLKDIMKFSTGVPWGEVKAEVWELTSSGVPSTNEVYSGALGGLGFGFGEQLATIANAVGVLSGGPIGNGLTENNGLPPDPYKDGPYTNRIIGIVNRIDTVKKRDPGINFEMQGLKIKFSYVARPIGGINSKAVMLDILGNFLSMGSPTAQFFGGAHRSRIAGRRFPASADPALKKLYQGKLFGEGGAIDAYVTRLRDFIDGAGGITGLLSSLWEAAKGLLGDLIGSFTGVTPKGLETEGKTAMQMKEGLKSAITEKMRSGMPVSYVSGMRALLTGEPVGDWHLTIGNPLNPIAMIGNLICTNLEVEIDEEAGFGIDDFPLGWTMTVTLDHGMKRDRDAIESMFNFGNGRIYELPDNFGSSADKQTRLDTATSSGNPNQKVSAESGGRTIDNPLKGYENKGRYRDKTKYESNEIELVDGNKYKLHNRSLIYLTDFAAKKSNRG